MSNAVIMKAIKLMEYSTQMRLTINQSYQQGWAKSLENFEKNLRDTPLKGRRRPKFVAH